MAMARMIGGPIVTAPMANPRRSGFYDVKCGRDQALLGVILTNILSGNTVSSKAKAGTVIGNFSHAGASGGQFVLDAGQLDAGPAADLAGKDLGPGSLAQIRAQHVAGDPPLAVAVDDDRQSLRHTRRGLAGQHIIFSGRVGREQSLDGASVFANTQVSDLAEELYAI